MKILNSIRNKYTVLKTNGILFAMCFTIGLYNIYILRYMEETMKIYPEKLKLSSYRVYFNGKICNKNKLFNPCDTFLW